MTTDLAKRIDDSASVIFDEHRVELSQLAPAGFDVDKMAVSYKLLMMDRPDLRECSEESLLKVVMNATRIGLPFDGTAGLGYTTPRKVHGRMTAIFIPGYQGLVKLAYDTARIIVATEVVLQGETFRPYVDKAGLPRIEHEIDPDRSRDVLKEFRGAYCHSVFPDGRSIPTYINIEDIKRLTDFNHQYKPGRKHPGEMAKKAPVRRASKFWPKTELLVQAIGMMDDAERYTHHAVATRIQGHEEAEAAEGDYNELPPAEPEAEPVAAPEPLTPKQLRQSVLLKIQEWTRFPSSDLDVLRHAAQCIKRKCGIEPNNPATLDECTTMLSWIEEHRGTAFEEAVAWKDD